MYSRLTCKFNIQAYSTVYTAEVLNLVEIPDYDFVSLFLRLFLCYDFDFISLFLVTISMFLCSLTLNCLYVLIIL